MPNRGEVWLVDLGLAQKARPALILNRAFKESDRALITVFPQYYHPPRLRFGRGCPRPVPQTRGLSRPECSDGSERQSGAFPGPAHLATVGTG